MAAAPGPADAGAAYNESWCVALLGLAESFRVSNPPRIRLCIQCIQASLQHFICENTTKLIIVMQTKHVKESYKIEKNFLNENTNSNVF